MEYKDVLDFLASGEMTKAQVEQLHVAAGDVLNPDDDWRGDKPFSIMVAEEQFSMVFKGKRQRDAINRLRDWMNDDLADALDTFMKTQGEGGKMSNNLIDNIRLLIAVVDPEIFIGLGQVLIGKDREFVDEYFDLAWIIGGAEMAYRSNPFIKKVVSAFFTRLG